MENDLISRNTLVAAIQEYQMNLFHNKLRLGEIDLDSASALANVERIVCEAPSVEAEPVRHGRWGVWQIIGYDGIHPVWGKPCSECGYETELYHPNYCPNCGAKMDAKEDAL